MERVSNERLANLTGPPEDSWVRGNGLKELRMMAAELREMREAMATFEKWLSAPGANGIISIERYEDGLFAADYVDDSTKTQRQGRGDSLVAALVALAGKEGGA